MDWSCTNNRCWELATEDCSEPSPNIWRKDPQLRKDNIQFISLISWGGFGPVFEVQHSYYKKRYALKINDFSWSQTEQNEEADAIVGRIFYGPGGKAAAERMHKTGHALSKKKLEDAGGMEALGGDLGLQEATDQGNWGIWHHAEVRTYLQYIRSGHPNIVNLEAFQQNEMDGMGWNLYFELCDAGTLERFVQSYWNNNAMIPEAYIWKCWEELMGALAFLHRTHPQYEQDLEVQDRLVVLHGDLDPKNVFLKYPEGVDPRYKDKYWPKLMIGDLGEAVYCVPGGGKAPATDPMHNNVAPIDYLPGLFYGPEENEGTDKSEVWAGGAIIHYMIHRGLAPIPILKERMDKGFSPWDAQRIGPNFPKVLWPVPPPYTKKLKAALKEQMVYDPTLRPTAGVMWSRLQSNDYKGQPTWPKLPRSPPDWYKWTKMEEPIEYELESDDELDSDDEINDKPPPKSYTISITSDEEDENEGNDDGEDGGSDDDGDGDDGAGDERCGDDGDDEDDEDGVGTKSAAPSGPKRRGRPPKHPKSPKQREQPPAHARSPRQRGRPPMNAKIYLRGQGEDSDSESTAIAKKALAHMRKNQEKHARPKILAAPPLSFKPEWEDALDFEGFHSEADSVRRQNAEREMETSTPK